MKTKFNNYISDNDLLFSQDFYDRYTGSDWDIDGMKKIYYDKLNRFNNFYEKYNPIGIRNYNGYDSYLVAKDIYDKIMNRELYVDKELSDPDNILRNMILLLHIDEIKIKNKHENKIH